MKNKFVKYILSVAVASCMTGCFDLDHEEFYNIDADPKIGGGTGCIYCRCI